jgi:hypothetical protein
VYVTEYRNLLGNLELEVQFQAFLTTEIEKDGKLASSLGHPSIHIKTRVNWLSSFCVYTSRIFQKRVGDMGKSFTQP